VVTNAFILPVFFPQRFMLAQSVGGRLEMVLGNHLELYAIKNKKLLKK
jgi:hypothetical protein